MSFGLLLLIYFVLFVYFTWRNLLWGLLIIVATLPSYLIRFSILGLPLTMLEVMILTLTIIWLIKQKSANALLLSLLSKKWLSAVALFLLAATISVFVSPNSRSAWGIWKAYFVEPAMFFFILISTIKNREEIQKILWVLTIGALPVAVLAVIQKFTGWLIPNPFWQAEVTRRVTSFFGYPNAVALFLAPLIPIGIYLLIGAIKKKKPALILCLALSILLFLSAVIFARSSGALAALTGTTVLIGLWFRRTRFWTAGLVLAAILFCWVTPLHDPLAKEFLFKDTSGQIRVSMWGETIEMLRSRPLLGAGLAGYQTAVQPYHILKWAEIYLYPHNLFLNFWTETGLLGLFSFLIIIWLFFQPENTQLNENWKLKIGNLKTAKTGQLLTKTLLASMCVIIIHGLVDVPYFKNDLAVVFWLILGLKILDGHLARETR